MKKQDLLRIKAAIVAATLTLSLNACAKKALEKPVKEEENKSNSVSQNEIDNQDESKNAFIFQSDSKGSYVYPDSYNNKYAVVVMENGKAIVFETAQIMNSNGGRIIFELENGDRFSASPDNAYTFKSENALEDALTFAHFYCDEVITYNDLKAQKLELTK